MVQNLRPGARAQNGPTSRSCLPERTFALIRGVNACHDNRGEHPWTNAYTMSKLKEIIGIAPTIRVSSLPRRHTTSHHTTPHRTAPHHTAPLPHHTTPHTHTHPHTLCTPRAHATQTAHTTPHHTHHRTHTPHTTHNQTQSQTQSNNTVRQVTHTTVFVRSHCAHRRTPS